MNYRDNLKGPRLATVRVSARARTVSRASAGASGSGASFGTPGGKTLCRHMARPLRGCQWAGLAGQGTTGRTGRAGTAILIHYAIGY